MTSAGTDCADMVVPPNMSFADLAAFDTEAKSKPFGSPTNGFAPPLDSQLPPDMLAAMYTPQPDIPITPGATKLASERELNELCDFFVPALTTQPAMVSASMMDVGGMPQQPRSRHRVLSDKGKQLLSELDYLHPFGLFCSLRRILFPSLIGWPCVLPRLNICMG